MYEDKTNYVMFSFGDMLFEYDEDKNQKNIQKHGISFRNAARVFFDYDRIEFYDEENSREEDRYDTIGNVAAGARDVIIGNVNQYSSSQDILFVVYTERIRKSKNGMETEVTRLISARFATSFERGLYYGKI